MSDEWAIRLDCQPSAASPPPPSVSDEQNYEEVVTHFLSQYFGRSAVTNATISFEVCMCGRRRPNIPNLQLSYSRTSHLPAGLRVAPTKHGQVGSTRGCWPAARTLSARIQARKSWARRAPHGTFHESTVPWTHQHRSVRGSCQQHRNSLRF